MQLMIPPGRLDRPVDHETEHVLGPSDAEITLVEYGSYACPHCRAANERIAHATNSGAIEEAPQRAECQHASVIGARRLCGIMNRRSFNDSTDRYDSSRS